MIKRFCDMCNDEITDKNVCVGGYVSSDRLGVEFVTKGKVLKVEFMLSYNGTTNAGDICRHCVIDAVNILDKRPKTKTG